MDGPRRLSVPLALCLALTALAPHAPAQEAAPARTLHVTVTDRKGNFVRGLKREDFSVLEGKRRHEPTSLGAPDAPATVGFVLDASGSTREMWAKVSKAKGGNLREALGRFLDGSHPANEYFVVAFNHQPHLLVEETRSGRDVLAVLERLGAAGRPVGPTAFYDALHFALERSRRGRHPKRVLVALTDGQDNASTHTFREVQRALAGSDVLVYGIGLSNYNDDNALGAAGRTTLKELSAPTGGVTFFPMDGRELLAAAERLAAELRSQYALGFAPAPPAKRDGWHEVKVTVAERLDEKGRRVKFEARTRRGFYDESGARAGAAP